MEWSMMADARVSLIEREDILLRDNWRFGLSKCRCLVAISGATTGTVLQKPWSDWTGYW